MMEGRAIGQRSKGFVFVSATGDIVEDATLLRTRKMQ